MEIFPLFRFPSVASLLLIGSLPLSAATISINPTIDAFVTTGPSNNLSGNNYGAAGALGVSASGSAKGEFQSLLQFDFSSVVSSFNTSFGAGNWAITGISLQLTNTSPNNAIFNSPNTSGSFSIDWIGNDSWVEGVGSPMLSSTSGLTFNSLPALTGPTDQTLGTFAYTAATSGTQVLSLTLASGFLTAANSGDLADLYMHAADSTISTLFNSQNNTTPASRPLLTITAVPEPSTCLLTALGSITLVLFYRFKPLRK